MTTDKSGARPKGLGLLANQTVEIEGALVARRRRPRGADRGKQQHEHGRRDPEEYPDRVADPVKVSNRDTVRISHGYLSIRQIVAVREMLDEGDLVVPQRHHTSADLAMVAGPQEVGANAASEEDDDQVEAGVVIA
jgi:hypothetical protein